MLSPMGSGRELTRLDWTESAPQAKGNPSPAETPAVLPVERVRLIPTLCLGPTRHGDRSVKPGVRPSSAMPGAPLEASIAHSALATMWVTFSAQSQLPQGLGTQED